MKQTGASLVNASGEGVRARRPCRPPGVIEKSVVGLIRVRPRSDVLVIALLVLLPLGLAAHEVPTDVRIQAFLKPDGPRLRLIVRAPVAAMTDLEWPTDGPMLAQARIPPALREPSARWIADRIGIYEGEQRLEAPRIVEVRASLPSDTSFDSYERALAHVTGPQLPEDTELVRNQALLDVLFEYSIQSDRSLFSIDPRFQMAGLRSVTALRFLPPNAVERAFQFHDDPGLVRLDPRWFQAARRFVADGFFHILDGIDHLLFLLCLVIPFRRFRPLILVVTSFTLAHSITLIASAYDMAPDALWFPPLVETLIAASIVYMALENIVSPALRRRWMITFAFGLVHGFGFSFALRENLQFAGNHLLTSLLSFNVGVEIGQLLVLVLFVPILELLFRFGVAERLGTIIVSALVAHTGWHWMTDRGGRLMLYQFRWPVFDAAFFALVLRWMMLMVIVAGVAWVVFGVLRRQTGPGGEDAATSRRAQNF